MDEETSLAERMLRAIIMQMEKAGIIPADLIADASAYASDKGDDDAAHALGCIFLETQAPSQSEWMAEQRRSQMRSIDGGKADE